MPMDIKDYDFTTAEGRAKFISDTPSGIYDGTNVDGDYVMVFVDNGEGMTIKTHHKDKPKFLECINYDENGWQEEVIYEPYM